MSKHWIVVGALATVGLLGTGCATKKFVRSKVAPLEERVASIEKKSGEHGESIDALETGLSSTNEKLADVDGRARAAGENANKANAAAADAHSAAEGARGAAGDARQLAEKGLDRTGRLEAAFEASANYQLLASQNVQFGVGRTELADDAKVALDELAAKVASQKRYVIEVQGFTDKTGSPATNLQLSRQRAEAVARYLNANHKVPLRAIHLIGHGSVQPVADNKTREGRKLNRRVEVRVFVPGAPGTGNAVAAVK